LFKNKLKLGLYIIIFLPVLGELIRLPFGPENGVLVSDLLIPILSAFWLYRYISDTPHLTGKKFLPKWDKPKKPPLTLPFSLFIIVGILSLSQSLLFLSPYEVIYGSMYLVRWFFYGLLYFITFHSIKNEKDFRGVLTALTISALLLAIAGFIQLTLYPDLAELEEKGWDPHINRLVSTWLDPNFVGGLLAFISTILLGITLHLKQLKSKIGLSIIILILVTALFLTYSRSAYLALAGGFFVVSLIKSKKLIIIGLILAIIGISASDRAQQRTAELVQSVTSIFTETPQTPDPTARLRLKNYQQTLYLIEKRPILGSGYNNLRAVNHQEGFVKNTEIHSAAGSDSSLLTILATTGILGFIPFLLIYIIALATTLKARSSFKVWPQARSSFKVWPQARNNNTPTVPQPSPSANGEGWLTGKVGETDGNGWAGYHLGLFGGIISLLIHSLFVNSLLYSPILIYFWIALGLSKPTPPAPLKFMPKFFMNCMITHRIPLHTKPSGKSS